MVMFSSPLLLLDLDETLVMASERPLALEGMKEVIGLHVYPRPGLAGFLELVAKRWRLAVWSTSSESYARAVTEVFLSAQPIEFVYSRLQCRKLHDDELGESIYLKDLERIAERELGLERVIAVDDSPQRYLYHPDNVVAVEPWNARAGDEELAYLGPYLWWLGGRSNPQAEQKRHWRHHPAARRID